VALDDWAFDKLTYLQNKFHNLSNESITLLTSLDEIIQNKIVGCWGHDQVLREFFRQKGYNVKDFPVMPDITMTFVHNQLPNYGEYLKRYDIAKTPNLDLWRQKA
jgi:hypothetical protein